VAAVLAWLVVFFCGGCCFLGRTINLSGFGFGGLGGVEVLGFFVFFRGIALSSAAFCGAIFVPQHCFMCNGIVLCAVAQFFVPRGCFCAAVLFL